uniref:RING finger protein 223-like n=1 Tax=Petromyzon marinus TaxID=7757 RepID=A0AAJ7XJ67_PETMA|nr:RING finger protein 223-like [Petromyzon marinus]
MDITAEVQRSRPQCSGQVNSERKDSQPRVHRGHGDGSEPRSRGQVETGPRGPQPRDEAELPQRGECPVCYHHYDNAFRTPKLLACGHTFCVACLARVVGPRPLPRPASLCCPLCRCPSRLPPRGAPGLPPDPVELGRLPPTRRRPRRLQLRRGRLWCRRRRPRGGGGGAFSMALLSDPAPAPRRSGDVAAATGDGPRVEPPVASLHVGATRDGPTVEPPVASLHVGATRDGPTVEPPVASLHRKILALVLQEVVEVVVVVAVG